MKAMTLITAMILPQPLKRTAHILAVTSTNDSFDPSASHGGAASIPLSTTTERRAELSFYRIVKNV